MKYIRDLYYEASTAEAGVDKLLAELSKNNASKDMTLMGYEGMAYLLQAKYSWNPYSKLKSFDKGKSTLEKAIMRDKNNVELRFLRFCTQVNSPSFLGYNSQIEEDKSIILNNWAELQDDDLKKRIKDYLLTTDVCNESDKKKLND